MTETNTTINYNLSSIIEHVDLLGSGSHAAFSQIEAVFRAIKSMTTEHSDIKKLADLGEYLAADKAIFAEHLSEVIVQDMKKVDR